MYPAVSLRLLCLLLIVILGAGCAKKDPVLPDYSGSFVGVWKRTQTTYPGGTVYKNVSELTMTFRRTGTNTLSLSWYSTSKDYTDYGTKLIYSGITDLTLEGATVKSDKEINLGGTYKATDGTSQVITGSGVLSTSGKQMDLQLRDSKANSLQLTVDKF